MQIAYRGAFSSGSRRGSFSDRVEDPPLEPPPHGSRRHLIVIVLDAQGLDQQVGASQPRRAKQRVLAPVPWAADASCSGQNTSWRRRPSGRRLAVSRLNRSFVGSLTTDGFRPEFGIERQLSHSRERSLVVLLRWQDCVRSRDLSSYHSRHRLRRSLLCSSTCYPVGASDRMVVGSPHESPILSLTKSGRQGGVPFIGVLFGVGIVGKALL